MGVFQAYVPQPTAALFLHLFPLPQELFYILFDPRPHLLVLYLSGREPDPWPRAHEMIK